MSEVSGSSAPDGKTKQKRGPRPRLFKKYTCQSDDCIADLRQLSFYCQRNHICPVSGGRSRQVGRGALVHAPYPPQYGRFLRPPSNAFPGPCPYCLRRRST